MGELRKPGICSWKEEKMISFKLLFKRASNHSHFCNDLAKI